LGCLGSVLVEINCLMNQTTMILRNLIDLRHPHCVVRMRHTPISLGAIPQSNFGKMVNEVDALLGSVSLRFWDAMLREEFGESSKTG
jgi:hypothetical protein